MIFEQKRKMFHCLAIIFPILYYWTSFAIVAIILVIANLIILSVDISRHSNHQIQGLVDKFFAPIIKPHEMSGTKNLSGMSYMFLGFLFTALLFHKNIVIISWLILVVSDSVASLFGQKYGTRTQYGKSIEGSAAFFVSAIITCLMAQGFFNLHFNFGRVIFAVLATTIAEFYSKKLRIDDNLLVPVVFCICA
jgi:dolichol kinase